MKSLRKTIGNFFKSKNNKVTFSVIFYQVLRVFGIRVRKFQLTEFDSVSNNSIISIERQISIENNQINNSVGLKEFLLSNNKNNNKLKVENLNVTNTDKIKSLKDKKVNKVVIIKDKNIDNIHERETTIKVTIFSNQRKLEFTLVISGGQCVISLGKASRLRISVPNFSHQEVIPDSVRSHMVKENQALEKYYNRIIKSVLDIKNNTFIINDKPINSHNSIFIIFS